MKSLFIGGGAIALIQATPQLPVPQDSNLITQIIQVAVGLVTIYTMLFKKRKNEQ